MDAGKEIESFTSIDPMHPSMKFLWGGVGRKWGQRAGFWWLGWSPILGFDYIVHSPLFYHIFILSLNVQIESWENWMPVQYRRLDGRLVTLHPPPPTCFALVKSLSLAWTPPCEIYSDRHLISLSLISLSFQNSRGSRNSQSYSADCFYLDSPSCFTYIFVHHANIHWMCMICRKLHSWPYWLVFFILRSKDIDQGPSCLKAG